MHIAWNIQFLQSNNNCQAYTSFFSSQKQDFRTFDFFLRKDSKRASSEKILKSTANFKNRTKYTFTIYLSSVRLHFPGLIDLYELLVRFLKSQTEGPVLVNGKLINQAISYVTLGGL